MNSRILYKYKSGQNKHRKLFYICELGSESNIILNQEQFLLHMECLRIQSIWNFCIYLNKAVFYEI